MRVGVEEAVLEDHLHPRLRDQVREPSPLLQGRDVVVEIDELDAVQELEGQHPRSRVVPVDLRHDDALRVGEVAAEGLCVARLELVVELLADRAGELVDKRLRVDEVEGADAFLDHARGLVEQREVGLDLARGVRALHLDRDLVAVRKHRAVHLADRGGGDRLLVEAEERLLEREPEVGLDHVADLRERERADIVLEAAELEDDVRRHDVGTGRQQLAELDERGAELVEHLAQVTAPLRPGRRLHRGIDLVTRRPRQNVRELVPLEEVAEAMPDRDLRDLRQAADLAGTRTRRHSGSVPRGGTDSHRGR